MTKMKKRIATLIFAIIAATLSVINIAISGKKMIAYDDLCFITNDYENYGGLRDFYFICFLFFFLIFIYLVYMIVRYKGKIYDKWFRAYKVYGIIDPKPDTEEGFVHPVFKRDGRYFVQDDYSNSKKIKRFIPLTNEEIQNIKKLSLFYEDSPYSVIIGDKILFGFKYNGNQLVIYTEKELNKFFTDEKAKYYLDLELFNQS